MGCVGQVGETINDAEKFWCGLNWSTNTKNVSIKIDQHNHNIVGSCTKIMHKKKNTFNWGPLNVPSLLLTRTFYMTIKHFSCQFAQNRPPSKLLTRVQYWTLHNLVSFASFSLPAIHWWRTIITPHSDPCKLEGVYIVTSHVFAL